MLIPGAGLGDGVHRDRHLLLGSGGWALGCIGAAEPVPGSGGRLRSHRGGEVRTVKKLLVLALVGFGVFAVWRKVQSDREELDLWTEATTGGDEG